MCDTIVLVSEKQLPEVSWNEDSPAFYIREIDDSNLLGMIGKIVQGKYYYEPTSFMGCSCGLSVFPDYKDDHREDYEQRVKDVQSFANYLEKHKVDNSLYLFSFNWEEFFDTYPQRDFHTQEMLGDEFYLDPLILLKVV